jgi:hypothetical protein
MEVTRGGYTHTEMSLGSALLFGSETFLLGVQTIHRIRVLDLPRAAIAGLPPGELGRHG